MQTYLALALIVYCVSCVFGVFTDVFGVCLLVYCNWRWSLTYTSRVPSGIWQLAPGLSGVCWPLPGVDPYDESYPGVGPLVYLELAPIMRAIQVLAPWYTWSWPP